MTQGWPARLVAGPGGVLLMGVIWGILASPKASAPSTARPTWSSGLRGLEWSGVEALAFWAAGLPFAGLALPWSTSSTP
jgi:hypothetical protein